MNRRRAVLERAKSIPHGRVTTYGDLSPEAPRFAGAVLHDCDDPDVPFRGERVDMRAAWVPPAGG